MENPESGGPRPAIEPWELDLIAAFAARVRVSTTDRADLQAELARDWLLHRIQKPAGIHNLEAYLKGFLRHKIADWYRERKREKAREVSLDSPASQDTDRPLTLEDVLASSESDYALQLDVRNFFQKLDPQFRRVLIVLIEEEGNQSRAAERLGCHRNTVRAVLHKIRELATRGFGISRAFIPGAGRRRSTPPRRAAHSVAIDVKAMERLSAHANGSTWRVLLWVASETARCKRRTVAFTWYRIAHKLSLDRGNVYRAGMRLIKTGLIFIENGKIGLQRRGGRPEGGEGV